jgi:TonB family protein
MNKLIGTALLALVLAPPALAEVGKDGSRPFAITFVSDIAPLAQPDYAYPRLAGNRGVDGQCEVEFVVSGAGKADAIRIKSCSSELFQGAAKRVLEQTAFKATGKVREGVRATIHWKLGAPGTTMLASR